MLFFIRAKTLRTKGRGSERAAFCKRTKYSAFVSVTPGAVVVIFSSTARQIAKSSGIHDGVRGGSVMARIFDSSFAFRPLPLWLPFRSPSSTVVSWRFKPHVRFRAADNRPEYIAAALAPFHVFSTTCHMVMRSFATAAEIVTDGTPKNECFWRGFVQYSLKPSLAFRKCPITKVRRSIAFCLGVKGKRNALLST